MLAITLSFIIGSAMPYHLDFDVLELSHLKKRLLEEDLIPSQLPLRDQLDEHIESLTALGITRWSHLSQVLRKDTAVKELSEKTDIPVEYLKLLSRFLRGCKPKAAPLADYPNIDGSLVSLLVQQGIKDSISLWTSAYTLDDRHQLAVRIGASREDLDHLVCLSDLSRIQWVSPLFALLLYEAGFQSVSLAAKSNSEELMHKVDEANKKLQLFMGKIGLKDMGRLIYLASFLPHELELYQYH